MHGYFNYNSLDNEKRYLRIQVDKLRRAAASHKQKREGAEDQVRELEKENKQKKQRIGELERELEEIKRQRDMYKNMVFKKNVLPESSVESPLLTEISQKKRGGQNGHVGHWRSKPVGVDVFKRIYTKTCPTCHTKLQRSKGVTTHTVEDIPAVSQIKSVVTEYSIERQWCSVCRKEVTVKPVEVIPGSTVGINVIVYIMLLKYGAKVPLDAIVLLLHQAYGFKLSKGGIIQILHRTKQWLGTDYERIKQQVRASPVIHADETSWRVCGINKWIWAFLSKDAVCYQVEESRGKGVSQEFFKDSNPHAVLVRDDYAAYQSIPLTQQSCWSHMLRKSHESVEQSGVSREMKILHKKLTRIYDTLVEEVKKPYEASARKSRYGQLLKDIRAIIRTPYKREDAIKIQTRVRNQNKNLLTALLHPEVPLTNNHAERTIRPLVVTRKISGGSRSPAGAHTHMTNMSIFQTIKLKNQPLVPTLKDHILNGVFGNY